MKCLVSVEQNISHWLSTEGFLYPQTMGNKASKVTTDHAVPGSALAGVELMYGVRSAIGAG